MTQGVPKRRKQLGPSILEAVEMEAQQAPAVQGARTMYLVKQLEMLLRSRMEPIVKSASLTVPQYTALSILAARPGLSSAELARSTFVSAQAAHALLTGLSNRGFILRKPSPEHAKILRLRLSKKGEQALRSCAIEIQQLEESMLSALEGNEAQTFHEGLRSCIRALENVDPEATASV